jgi:hypothetical protein
MAAFRFPGGLGGTTADTVRPSSCGWDKSAGSALGGKSSSRGSVDSPAIMEEVGGLLDQEDIAIRSPSSGASASRPRARLARTPTTREDMDALVAGVRRLAGA